MLESTIESAITKYAKDNGILSFKFTSPSNRGVPDRIFINIDSDVFFIEFKRKKGIISPLQNKIFAKMRKNGCIIHVINNTEDGIELIDSYVRNVKSA